MAVCEEGMETALPYNFSKNGVNGVNEVIALNVIHSIHLILPR